MSLGVKIHKIYEGRIFTSGGMIFKDYIQHLYEIRKKAQKNSVDNVLSKLLMNSTYGRCGLNVEREGIEFYSGQEFKDVYSDIELSDGKFARLVKTDVYLDNSFVNVAIAAWVTSLARIHMHKLIMAAPESMYNMDTDSLFTTHKYPSNADDLGELKFEYGETEAACFLLPKTYIVKSLKYQWDDIDRKKGKKWTVDGSRVVTNKKIVMKGFDKRKIRDFEFEDFEECLKGEMMLKTTNPEKFATFKTALNDGQFLKLLEESPREIRSRYDKRRIIKRRYEQVYDTEPLHIKDGEIVNKL